MGESFVSVSAGLMHWNGIRGLAAELGLQVEESRGFLRRHFVLRGDDEALMIAKEHIDEFIAHRQQARGLI